MEPSTSGYSCKWLDCQSVFTSELDMGMHVICSHLNVLDHGHFVLERGSMTPSTSTRDSEATTPRKITGKSSEVPKSLPARIPVARQVPESIRRRSELELELARMEQRTEKTDYTQRKLLVSREKLREAAHSLIVRLRLPPLNNKRLFQTEHFCIICQDNCSSPCPKKHRADDLQVVEDWKRQFGHLKPSKKLLMKQLRQMMDQYAPGEEEMDVDLAPEETDSTMAAPEEVEEEDEVMEEGEEESGATQKMSKLCSTLISRLRMRNKAFRSVDRSNFCLNCLSFAACCKDHSIAEKQLAATWKKLYGRRRVSVESLIEQLEEMRDKYLKEETDEAAVY